MSQDVNPERLLSAVSDHRFRHILAAIAGEPLTAGEISKECELPRSTVYRRVRSLKEDGLVEETLRVDRYGSHSKEYGLCCEDLSASMEVDGSIEIGAFLRVTTHEDVSEKLIHPSP